jgi:hypothetical protein
MYEFKSLEPSKISTKKWTANFFDPKTLRSKKVHFGGRGYRDYTTIGERDEALKARAAYRSRHKNDKINDPYSPGALSWWILWGDYDNTAQNLSAYRRKFSV